MLCELLGLLAKLSNKKKLDKKTSLLLILCGVTFCVVGFVATDDMFLLVALFSLGIMLMIFPLVYYNYSDDGKKRTEQKQRSLTKNEICGMLIFSLITLEVIGFFAVFQEWVYVFLLSVFVGDVAVIFLLVVIADYRDKRKMKKHPRSLCLPKPTNKSAIRFPPPSGIG